MTTRNSYAEFLPFSSKMKLPALILIVSVVIAALWRKLRSTDRNTSLLLEINGTKAAEELCFRFIHDYHNCNHTAIDQYNHCWMDQEEIYDSHISLRFAEQLRREGREFCAKRTQEERQRQHNFCNSYWLNEGCSVRQLKIIFQSQKAADNYINLGIKYNLPDLALYGVFESKYYFHSYFTFFSHTEAGPIITLAYRDPRRDKFIDNFKLIELLQLPCQWENCNEELVNYSLTHQIYKKKLLWNVLTFLELPLSIQKRLKIDFAELPKERREKFVNDHSFIHEHDRLILQEILPISDLHQLIITFASNSWQWRSAWEKVVEMVDYRKINLESVLEEICETSQWSAIVSLSPLIRERQFNRTMFSYKFENCFRLFLIERKEKLNRELSGKYDFNEPIEYSALLILEKFLYLFQGPFLYDLTCLVFHETQLLNYYERTTKEKETDLWFHRKFFFEFLTVELTDQEWLKLTSWLNYQVPDFIRPENWTFFGEK